MHRLRARGSVAGSIPPAGGLLAKIRERDRLQPSPEEVRTWQFPVCYVQEPFRSR